VKISHNIEFVSFTKINENIRSDPGHGIFINCGGKRINVGAIVTLGNVEVLLNIEIRREMQATGYQICDLSKCFDTIDEAVTAARSFLSENYLARAESIAADGSNRPDLLS
jgi:hypothetical protein